MSGITPSNPEPAEQPPAQPTSPPSWPSQSAPPPGGPAAPPPGYAPGYPPPGYPPAGSPPVAYPSAPYPPAAQTSTNAIVALVLAVASWLICPIVPAIVALVFASKATKELRASGGAMQGSGLVLGAQITAWINIGLYAALIVFFGLFFLVALVAGAASSTIPA